MNAPLVRRSLAVVVNAARFLPVAELFNELLAADFSRPVVGDNLNGVIASVSFFHVYTSKIKKRPLRIGVLSVAVFRYTSYRILATRAEQAAIQHTKK